MHQLFLAARVKKILLFLLVAAALTGCGASTQIVKSWHQPNAQIQPNATNKTLVIALVKDESSRRSIEDQLVKRIGPNAVASYSVITADMIKEGNGDKLGELLKNYKYNYVLIMRLADVEKETSYVPGTTTGYYGGYGRYYGYGAGIYSTPGYYTTDKHYYVETTVYSVNPDQLIWTGVTKTVNPTKLDKIIADIAEVVSDKMRSDGFIR